MNLAMKWWSCFKIYLVNRTDAGYKFTYKQQFLGKAILN